MKQEPVTKLVLVEICQKGPADAEELVDLSVAAVVDSEICPLEMQPLTVTATAKRPKIDLSENDFISFYFIKPTQEAVEKQKKQVPIISNT